MKRVHLLRLASLAVIFGVAGLGVPNASSAAQGCSEMIACSTEGACEISTGEQCDEHGCSGIKVCAPDVNDECTGPPACNIFECEVLLCVNW